jgi:hypothetical protein
MQHGVHPKAHSFCVCVCLFICLMRSTCTTITTRRTVHQKQYPTQCHTSTAAACMSFACTPTRCSTCWLASFLACRLLATAVAHMHFMLNSAAGCARSRRPLKGVRGLQAHCAAHSTAAVPCSLAAAATHIRWCWKVLQGVLIVSSSPMKIPTTSALCSAFHSCVKSVN